MDMAILHNSASNRASIFVGMIPRIPSPSIDKILNIVNYSIVALLLVRLNCPWAVLSSLVSQCA